MTMQLDLEVGPTQLVSAACLFHGFSDPNRLAIVRHLALGEHRVVDLTNHLGLAQSTTSAHLRCLLDCGLVTVRTQGRASLYSLAHPQVIRQLFAAADELLEATGEAVVLCENFGADALHATDVGETVMDDEGQR